MELGKLYAKYFSLLKSNNVDSADLECKILLSYILNIDMKDIFFHINDTYDIEDKIEPLIKRRLNGEPLTKIIGYKTFWEYDFLTNSDVLDPRSDSETMIDFILKDYKKDENLKILDLGTGSGCLILTLLKLYKNASGVAVDINEKSLIVARKNAENLGLKNIIFLHSNWNDKVNGDFDIIISNPPYIKNSEVKNLSVAVKKYDPILALDGGSDGLECYRYIAKNIKKNCKYDSKLYFEIGYGQKNDVIEIFKSEGFDFLAYKTDLNNIDRVLKFGISG